jgi:hypothetical protein
MILAWIIVAITAFVLAMLVLGCVLLAAKVPPTKLRRLSLKLEPRDLWIGCYLTAAPEVRVYVCMIPAVVLILSESSKDQQ